MPARAWFYGNAVRHGTKGSINSIGSLEPVKVERWWTVRFCVTSSLGGADA